ncbi:MAG: hypothetical protein KatS3mg071_1207 [Meiothermus sp.]|nr:MAG: hypothetical protein KatS3mg071_1207 [Meiothermus sp.]
MMLRLPRACLERTLAHLRAALPHEGVGLWVGRVGRVVEFWPLRNVHPRPRERYEADPQALIEAVRRLEQRGLELLAIVHSHPSGPALPSEADRAQAYWRVPYVIFDMRTGGFRAFCLPQAEEVPVWLEG